MRKGPGKEARLCFGSHAMMENRNGLCVLFDVKPAVGATGSSVAVCPHTAKTPDHNAGRADRGAENQVWSLSL